jgi:hypothetical protein
MRQLRMKTLIIILLSNVFTLCYAQSLTGRYKSDDGKEFVFNKKKFEYTEISSSDYGRFTLKGTFKIIDNKLILYPKKDPVSDSSKYLIAQSSSIQNNNIAIISITTDDTIGSSIDSSIYILKDVNDKILLTLNKDCAPFKFTLYDKASIAKIVVAAEGYKRLEIPMREFYGKSVDIKAYLSSIGTLESAEQSFIEYKISAFTDIVIEISKDGKATTFSKIK